MEPFTLTPACKDYLWGGRRLKDDWGMRTDLEMVAESWELSAHPAGRDVRSRRPFGLTRRSCPADTGRTIPFPCW